MGTFFMSIYGQYRDRIDEDEKTCQEWICRSNSAYVKEEKGWTTPLATKQTLGTTKIVRVLLHIVSLTLAELYIFT